MELKYRVHEFAKDMGLKSTDVMERLDQFSPKERNHMAVLAQEELDYLFNYYTLQNEVKDFNAYFALASRPDVPGAKKKTAPKPAEKLAEKPEEKKAEEPKKKEEQKGPRLIYKAEKPAADLPKKTESASQKKPPVKKPAAAEKSPVRAARPVRPAVPEREAVQPSLKKSATPPKKKEKGPRQVQTVERTVRVVDTRVNDVNLGKYDDKLMDLASSHESRNASSFKQKIQKKKDWQRHGQYGMKKKKDTEAERLKRIELQRKQAKMKIEVPDEISVSELALRMKVNVAQVVKKLMTMGIMAAASQIIDFDTAYLVAEEFDIRVEKDRRSGRSGK